MITDRYRTLLMLLASLLTTAAASAQEGSQMPYQILNQREDRLVVQLPNRMIVAVQEIRVAPVVSAQVWIKTGSIYEQEHVGAGLSHFLEHLLAGGATSTRSEEQTRTILGQIGARTNASTSLDNVIYYIDTTSDHTDTCVELLTDWMRNSLIRNEEYERERQVIQREFESGMGSPGRIFWKLTQQARYLVHPARHPTIGYLDEFLSIKRDEIYDFYRRMYVPNNMVFVVAGDVDKKHVVEKIASLWGTAEEGKLPDLRLPLEQKPSEPRTLTGQATIQQPKLRLAWSGTRLAGPHDYALDLLSMVLGEGESSRLVKAVRDERQAVTTIDAYNMSFPWGEGFFGVDCDVRELNGEQAANLTPEQARASAIDRAKAAILEEIGRVRTEGVTDQELARAKRKVLARTQRSNQTAHGIASRLAGDIIQMGDPDYVTRYAQAIQELTLGELQAAAVEYLDPQHLITVVLEPLPRGEKLPDLSRPVDGIAPENVQHEPVVLDNAGLIDRIHAAKPKDDGATAALELAPIQRFELTNGLRLIVQRSTLVPAVSIQFYSLGGLLADAPGREGVANAVAAMLMKGTATRSAEQIAWQIEDLGADMGTSGGNNTTYVQAECLKEDWPALLELTADVIIRPTFPEAEWARYQPRLAARIRRQNDDWSGQLGKAFRNAFFTDQHPWSQTVAGRAEVITALTAEEMRSFHRQHLGAAHSVLVVFGDVDPAEVARRAEELFVEMPAQAEIVFNPPLPPAPAEAVHPVDRALAPAAVQIGFGPGATRRSPDYPALSVLAKVLSDFPAGWLENELRGSKGDGLVYGVWCYQQAGIVPGSFVVGFNTEPKLVEEAIRRTTGVIQRAKTQAVDEADLSRAKAAVLVGEFIDKQSNGSRGAEAALNALYGLDPDESTQFAEDVRNLTPELLQMVARMYLQNPVTVILAPQPPPQTQPAETPAAAAPAATQPASP